MPRLELSQDFGYSKNKDVKEYMKNKEQGIKDIQNFFPQLWDSKYNGQFYSEIAKAIQWGTDLATGRVEMPIPKGKLDIHLTLKRLMANELSSIQSRQDGDAPAYIEPLIETPYDLLPPLVSSFFIIDGHHRMESYRTIGMSPLVLQITVEPATSDDPKIIAKYDSSVSQKTLNYPKMYQRYVEENEAPDTIKEDKPPIMDEESEEPTKLATAKKKSFDLETAKKLPYSFLNRILNKLREYLKKDEVVQKMFKDYGADINEIDFIPMKFGEIDVSAKTDHGIITYNYQLLTDGDFFKDFSYGVHEITHYLQQTCGKKPTQSSHEGSYLDNPFEQEGFKNQIEYISKEFGDDEADKYVENLLDHHEVDSKSERKNKKEELMSQV